MVPIGRRASFAPTAEFALFVWGCSPCCRGIRLGLLAVIRKRRAGGGRRSGRAFGGGPRDRGRAIRADHRGRSGTVSRTESIVPSVDKVALVDALSAAGFPEIETTSFVSPQWVPQLARRGEVLRVRRRSEPCTRPSSRMSWTGAGDRGGRTSWRSSPRPATPSATRTSTPRSRESIERVHARLPGGRGTRLPGAATSPTWWLSVRRSDRSIEGAETVERQSRPRGPRSRSRSARRSGVARPTTSRPSSRQVSTVVDQGGSTCISRHQWPGVGDALALDLEVEPSTRAVARTRGMSLRPGIGKPRHGALLDMLDEAGWRRGIDAEQVLAGQPNSLGITGR